MAGELCGVLDDEDLTESSLDDRLEIEQLAQGEESNGKVTVSGACGGVEIDNGVTAGLVNGVFVSAVGDIIVGVNVVVFEIDEIVDVQVERIAVDDVNVGETASIDVRAEDDVANEFGDVTANDVAVVEAGAGDEVVDVVSGDEETVGNDSNEVISDGATVDDVIAEDAGDVDFEDNFVSDFIIDASKPGKVSGLNEFGDCNETTDKSVDAMDNVSSFTTTEEVEVGESVTFTRTVSVLGFNSVANVSLLFDASMLFFRY